MKSKYDWTWTAYGKHPIAGDYFKLDSDCPLFAAFFNWIEKGYQMLSSKSSKTLSTYSWRFWTRGLDEHDLACGIMKDSSDSIGRPYPFLMLGHGRFEGWGAHWELLPLALVETWEQMEHLSIRRSIDLRDLEIGVGRLKPPSSDWSTIMQHKPKPGYCDSLDQGTIHCEFMNAIKDAEDYGEKDHFYLPLDNISTDAPFAWTDRSLGFLKDLTKGVPNTVFIGGIPERTYLAVFKRPLVPRDFVQLWTIFSKEDLKNGSFVTGKRTD